MTQRKNTLPMLSKINTILLGLIAQKPLNPYEIQHILNKINIRDWFSIADSSVYAGIRALHKKGWIQGEVHKESNMPEKTIYQITAEGSEVLLNSIFQYLSSLDVDLVVFYIGIYFMCLLNKDEVTMILNDKLKSLDEEMSLLKKQLDDSAIPFIANTMIKHQIYLRFSEIRTIREVLERIEQDPLWSDRLALDWYEQIIDLPGAQPLHYKKSTVSGENDPGVDFPAK